MFPWCSDYLESTRTEAPGPKQLRTLAKLTQMDSFDAELRRLNAENRSLQETEPRVDGDGGSHSGDYLLSKSV